MHRSGVWFSRIRDHKLGTADWPQLGFCSEEYLQLLMGPSGEFDYSASNGSASRKSRNNRPETIHRSSPRQGEKLMPFPSMTHFSNGENGTGLGWHHAKGAIYYNQDPLIGSAAASCITAGWVMISSYRIRRHGCMGS